MRTNDTGTFSKEYYLGKGDIEVAGQKICGIRLNESTDKMEFRLAGGDWIPFYDFDVHRTLDTLVHEIAEDSYTTYTYNGGTTIASMTIWTNAGMTTKIREYAYTYDGILIDTETVTQYNAAGVLASTLTYTYNYTDGKVTSVTCVES